MKNKMALAHFAWVCGFVGFVAVASAIGLPLDAKENPKGAKMIVQMSFENVSGGKEVARIDLEDNPATRDFFALLPLKLTFRDYVGKEKISTALPKNLNTSGLNGYDPQIGDLFYFAPWGNLGIFYEKQPFHSGLVRFGSVDSQILAKIKARNDNFIITFEKAK